MITVHVIHTFSELIKSTAYSNGYNIIRVYNTKLSGQQLKTTELVDTASNTNKLRIK